MTLRWILLALTVLALVGVVGWQFAERDGPTVVVRYQEPPAHGTGRTGLISCGLRIEDATGKLIAAREVPASKSGGKLRTVHIKLTSPELARAERVLAACTDAAGRTGQSSALAVGPTREPLTRMASQKP